VKARPTETAWLVNGLMFTFVSMQKLQEIAIFLPKNQKKEGSGRQQVNRLDSATSFWPRVN